MVDNAGNTGNCSVEISKITKDRKQIGEVCGAMHEMRECDCYVGDNIPMCLNYAPTPEWPGRCFCGYKYYQYSDVYSCSSGENYNNSYCYKTS